MFGRPSSCLNGSYDMSESEWQLWMAYITCLNANHKFEWLISHVSLAQHTCCNGCRNNLKTRRILSDNRKGWRKCKSWRVIRLPLYQSLPRTHIQQSIPDPSTEWETPTDWTRFHCSTSVLNVSLCTQFSCYKLFPFNIDRSKFLIPNQVSTVMTHGEILDGLYKCIYRALH